MSANHLEQVTPTGEMSGTLGIMPPPNPPNTGAAPRRGYAGLWRGVPRELGFLLLTMPIAVVGLVVLSTVVFTGTGLLAALVGIFLVVAALYVARGFGALELVRLRGAGHPPIPEPEWPKVGAEAGFWRTTLGPLADGHYWTYLLHGLVINPIE